MLFRCCIVSGSSCWSYVVILSMIITIWGDVSLCFPPTCRPLNHFQKLRKDITMRVSAQTGLATGFRGITGSDGATSESRSRLLCPSCDAITRFCGKANDNGIFCRQQENYGLSHHPQGLDILLMQNDSVTHGRLGWLQVGPNKGKLSIHDKRLKAPRPCFC